MINRIVLVTGLLSCFLDTGDSIRCFECSSTYDPSCADPFDNVTIALTNCEYVRPLPNFPEVKATMCQKARQKVNGTWKYDRGCAFPIESNIDGDQYCVTRTSSYNFTEVCTCVNKDGCNNATSYKLPLPVLFMCILGTLLNVYHGIITNIS